MPSTIENPILYQRLERSEKYLRINAQVTKEFSDGFEAYLGVENLTNYTQWNPIIASEEPFGEYFDASMVWAPVFGRNIYFGLRYNVPQKIQ